MIQDDEVDKIIQTKEEKDRSICGTVPLTFQFPENQKLECNEKDCRVEIHYQDKDNLDLVIKPLDVNVDYCYQIQKEEIVSLVVESCQVVEISCYQIHDHVMGDSYFYVSSITISPCGQFLFIILNLKIVSIESTKRLIIIDLINQQIKKIYYSTYFMGTDNFQFSSDGKLVFIDITSNTYQSKQSRFLILYLNEKIQKEGIIELDDINFYKLDYDNQSGCLFYINSFTEIYQLPFNLQDFSVDKSKMQVYKCIWEVRQMWGYYIQLTVISNLLALIVDQFGKIIIVRNQNVPKIIRGYNFHKAFVPQLLFNKKFAIMKCSNTIVRQQFLFMNLQSGKVIRYKRDYSNQQLVHSFRSDQSYLMTLLIFKYREIDSYQKEHINYDLVRGTQKIVNNKQPIDKNAKLLILTQDLIVQAYDKKIIYRKQLN